MWVIFKSMGVISMKNRDVEQYPFVCRARQFSRYALLFLISTASGVASAAEQQVSGVLQAGDGRDGNAVSAQAPTTPTFSDVPTTHWAFNYIETMAASGITSGCGDGLYCPDATTTRAQMAIFLERGIHGSDYLPPSASGNVFDDVPANHWAAAWIEQLVADGVTSGCSATSYCPASEVDRAQMAVFLLRAKYGAGYVPPAPTGTLFDDVPVDHWAAAWIEQLAAEGITSGCTATSYCPDDVLNRAQMAVFIVRTFNLGQTFNRLNDTGITWGGDYPYGNNPTCVSNINAPQDCHQGRDATHNDDSDGHAGFSFTKLDANGNPLPASASSWSCVKDNVTGLVWEVKTDDGGIHDKDNTYRWGGVTAQGSGYGTYYDDWDSLVNGSNSEALCGYSDWRVPTIEELQSIVNYNRTGPSIDTAYFPNTVSSDFWSSSPSAPYSDSAWYVYFAYGYAANFKYDRYYDAPVRLVRSGQ
jgi:hypothetical protein